MTKEIYLLFAVILLATHKELSYKHKSYNDNVTLNKRNRKEYIGRGQMKENGCYSVEAAPRCPELKLSINRTHFRSSGTVVPPDVTQTTLEPRL